MTAPMNDALTSKRRRRKREIRPDIDRRTAAPFNAETVDRIVPDPYSSTGGKIVVTASLRDDALGQLYARKHIDDAQYLAGLKLREWFDLAEIGSIQAIDPGKEAVDGRGQYVEPITDMQMWAHRQLVHVRSVLGHFGYDLCRAVIASGMTMEAVAATHGPVTQLTIKYFGKRFRECLQTLAMDAGAAGGRKRAPRDKYAELAQRIEDQTKEESENVRQS
jgi:hypothetical protein